MILQNFSAFKIGNDKKDLQIFTTHPTKQLKTTLVSLVLLLVCNLILAQLDEIWKTTSTFFKLEYNLNFFKMKRTSIFKKWKII
jgi:hypothetical protein